MPNHTRDPILLTPGAFMVEHVALSRDRKFMIYDANTGSIRLLPNFCAGRARLPTNRSRALNTTLTQRNALP